MECAMKYLAKEWSYETKLRKFQNAHEGCCYIGGKEQVSVSLLAMMYNLVTSVGLK